MHQTLREITEWLAVREAHEQDAWPALLVCSNLGAHRDTVLDIVKSLNQYTETRLGVIYLQGTKNPPLEKTVFASQLYCYANGKTVLRRHQNHQSFHLEKTPVTLHTPSKYRSSAHKSLS